MQKRLAIGSGGVDMRVKVTMACQECKQRNYDTMKNKKNDPERREANKYCRFCKKHTPVSYTHLSLSFRCFLEFMAAQNFAVIDCVIIPLGIVLSLIHISFSGVIAG